MSYQLKVNQDDSKSVREFILRKSYNQHDLTADEENFLDALNRQVSLF